MEDAAKKEDYHIGHLIVQGKRRVLKQKRRLIEQNTNAGKQGSKLMIFKMRETR